MVKKYYPIRSIDSSDVLHDDRANFMRVQFYYDLGGVNVWTYKREPRGYYVVFQPVERDGIMEGFVAFSGKKYLVKEVARKSAKAEAEALVEAEAFIKDTLAHMCAKLGYALMEGVEV